MANFIAAPPDVKMPTCNANTHVIEWATNATGCILEVTSVYGSTNWTVVNAPVSVVGSNAQVTLPTQPGARFYRLKLP